MKRIALIGDHRDSVPAHRGIPLALSLAVGTLDAAVAWDWLPTRTLVNDVPALLKSYSGIWCVPASPYENARGALEAIRFARESQRPFLGTCGGFQHALLEYAAQIWQIDALHAETDTGATAPVIAPLMCALREVTGALHLPATSTLATLYGSDRIDEEYHCSFGLNPVYRGRLRDGPLVVAATDDDGDVRAVELQGHPFFFGTLFQPERAALRGVLSPLIAAFVKAVDSYPLKPS